MRMVREGDDGTISYAEGGWGTLHCRCGCAVGKADPLGRKWWFENGVPAHDTCSEHPSKEAAQAAWHESVYGSRPTQEKETP